MAEEPLEAMYRVIVAAAEVGRLRVNEGDLTASLACATSILSAGSKLHARLKMLSELKGEGGHWAAEVDRALARAADTGPQAIPGDQPLPFDDTASTPKPSPKGTRRTRAKE